MYWFCCISLYLFLSWFFGFVGNRLSLIYGYLILFVEYFSYRKSNPFGMRPPCSFSCRCNDRFAVYGYGDVDADFHVVGDYPGVHGGWDTGVPFTETDVGRSLQSVLYEVGFLEEEYSDEPSVYNLFFSYIYMCCTKDDRRPSRGEYRKLRPFFDAEVRAITADVLVPVGKVTTRYIIDNYTNKSGSIVDDMDDIHGSEIRGLGFLVLPTKDPCCWKGSDRNDVVSSFEDVLGRDYSQISDLGRFNPEKNFYFVR